MPAARWKVEKEGEALNFKKIRNFSPAYAEQSSFDGAWDSIFSAYDIIFKLQWFTFTLLRRQDRKIILRLFPLSHDNLCINLNT